MAKRDLLRIDDLSREEIDRLIQRSQELKAGGKKRRIPPLRGKTIVLLFEKPSTRTRVSFEAGIYSLGGDAVCLAVEGTQISRGETLADTARTLSRYAAGIVFRTASHARLEEFSRYSQVPVINGLSDRFHPCQVLSDLFTISELGIDYRDVRVAYIGDGNNVANSWVVACGRIGFHLALASPPGYEVDREVLEEARALYPDRIQVGNDPAQAVSGADVVYTDVWVSMGQEAEEEAKMEALAGFQVNSDLMEKAKPGAVFMHCLPAHRGVEVSEEVIDGPQSVVWEQAENRMHLQKALLEMFIRGKERG